MSGVLHNRNDKAEACIGRKSGGTISVIPLDIATGEKAHLLETFLLHLLEESAAVLFRRHDIAMTVAYAPA